MSQENVDVVVSALEKWNSGDDTGALESLAPDLEVHHNIGRGTPLEGVYHGHAEVRKLWADIRDSFAEARFDIDRATEHAGVVLILAGAALISYSEQTKGDFKPNVEAKNHGASR